MNAADLIAIAAVLAETPPAPPEPTPLQTLLGMTAALAITVAVVLVAHRFVRLVNVPCPFCDNRDLTRFADLPPYTQDAIDAYFRDHERRRPHIRSIFVCQHCRTVFDDFSGVGRSRDYHAWTGNRAYCKVCNYILVACDPGGPDIRCPNCATPYEWKTHDRSGFRLLTPPPDARLLARCIHTGSA